MRIYYKRIIRSTQTESSELIKHITSELVRNGYQITNKTNETVQFKTNFWVFGSRMDVYKKVDGGEFYINGENNTILLKFYLSPIVTIIIFCLVSFFGFIKDYHFFFCDILFIVGFLTRLISLRMAGEELMEDVLSPE
jgi:hypothetical protein